MKVLIVLIFCSLFTISVAYSQLDGYPVYGDWLWVRVHTLDVGGAAAMKTGIDYLSKASNGKVKQFQIAKKGAVLGNSVGDTRWQAAYLYYDSNDNISEVFHQRDNISGYLHNQVAYGYIALDSDRKQNTNLFVGSDDAVKVWLNGKLVHKNAVDRPASDFQEAIPVTLRAGKNHILVAVYNGEWYWSGYFGFSHGTSYSVISPYLSFIDVNKDGRVNATDLKIVINDFNKSPPTFKRSDINKDNDINTLDLLILMSHLDDLIHAAAPPKNKITTTWGDLKRR